MNRRNSHHGRDIDGSAPSRCSRAAGAGSGLASIKAFLASSPDRSDAIQLHSDGTMKRIPLLAVSVIAMTAILALSAPTGGVAHHRPGHNPPGHAKTGMPRKASPGIRPSAAVRRIGRRHGGAAPRPGFAIGATAGTMSAIRPSWFGCPRPVSGRATARSWARSWAALPGPRWARNSARGTAGRWRPSAVPSSAPWWARNIGRAMDQVDQNCVGQVLERAPTGRAVTWRNPDNGGEYQVTPSRSYQTGAGTHCRDYQTRIVIDGRVRTGTGTACRQPDGAWKKI